MDNNWIHIRTLLFDKALGELKKPKYKRRAEWLDHMKKDHRTIVRPVFVILCGWSAFAACTGDHHGFLGAELMILEMAMIVATAFYVYRCPVLAEEYREKMLHHIRSTDAYRR